MAFALPHDRRLQRLWRTFPPEFQGEAAERHGNSRRLQQPGDAARDATARCHDGESRCAHLGRGAGRRPRSQRRQPAAAGDRRHRSARRPPGPAAYLSERRGGDRQNDGARGHEGEPFRRRKDVSRAREPGANGVGHERPALGLGVAQLSRAHARRAKPGTSS